VSKERVTFTFDGVAVHAQRGQTVAGALLADGVISWRVTRSGGRPRGLFCGIGACFDCLVDVNDDLAVRACLVPVDNGDRVRTSGSVGAIE
jgi:predicted molibdopterin-dependent oxidoreductase YjgC